MKDHVIIVPVHGQLEYLKVCVKSIYDKTRNPKLIIVDDGSPDIQTTQWIKSNQAKYGYDMIFHEKAQGFSRACNDGIDYALETYDFECLCLLNSDTEIITDNWFAKVEWYFVNGGNIGVASVMSDNALAQTVRHFGQYMQIIDHKPAVYSILLHGFCYFISKNLLHEIGKLDEEMFPHYGSEDDYSLMSNKAGYKNLLIGKVFVHHANSKSYTDAQRSKIVLKSFPDLNKKWGKNKVSSCGIYSLKAAQYVNNYKPNNPRPNGKL